MSGTKTNRTDLENRFKKGMYPTENDFANVFASYVHKDDAITLSQITLEEGGGNLGEVIDSKADKQTLETFVREVETVLETTRDSETGAITNSAISSLAQRITDAENDIASAANAAETNGDSIAKILTILGKQNGESVSELASRFSALSGDYATVFAFVSKVKTFLESADVADTTINRWQEIEAFLQGITDTETLTGLLQQMKQEILAEIPSPQSGNFIEYTTDLDAITDAPNGKIMQYWGQSNDKYKRGQFYERVEGEGVEIPAKTKYNSTADMYLLNSWQIPVGVQQFGKDWWITLSGTTDIDTLPESLRRLLGEMKVETIHFKNGSMTALFTSVTTVEGDFWQKLPNLGEISQGTARENGVYEGITGNGDRYLFTSHYFFKISDGGRFEKGTVDYTAGIMSYYYDHAATTIETPSSWQHIHVDEVID